MQALDAFELQAASLLTSPQARLAFDLGKEDARVRDRYGRNAWGQQCLMARRLVEAGVELITTVFDGPLCGRVSNWDDHAVNHHVFEAIKFRRPFSIRPSRPSFKTSTTADWTRRSLVVVTGEFGALRGSAPRPTAAADAFSRAAITGRRPIPCCSPAAEFAPARSSVPPTRGANK